MLREENEQLVRVGRGAPMGEMMRRYWHPIALSTQVAEPDGAPLRTKLLGQSFVVFRDTSGKVGVLDERCMHRGVSLALGRNEQGGLRCIYHGWKFAVDGTILETPNHEDCRFREKNKANAYPVREQGGLIWTYIGPKELEPPFRKFGWDDLPDTHRTVFRANTPCNWLALWEGGLDSSHVGILHSNTIRPNWRGESQTDASQKHWYHLAPSYEVEDTEFGFHYCAFRPTEKAGVRNARVVPAIMPYMRIIPGVGEQNYAIEVPMDDHHTATYIYAYSQTQPVNRDTWQKWLGFDNPLYDPETCDVRLNWKERLGQDRSKMDASWSGVHGLEIEDFVISASLGDDWDRVDEHLVTADIAVVRLRRRLLQALRDFQAGGEPPALNIADMSRVICYDQDIGPDDDWQDLVPGNRTLLAAE